MSKRNAIENFLEYKEVALFALVVVIMLILLFPKKEIITTILTDPNYIPPEFIKAVIRVDPKSNLKIALIKDYLKARNFKKADFYFKKIKYNVNSVSFFDYAKFKFNMLEDEYYFTKNNDIKKRRIKKSIQSLFSIIAKTKSYKLKKYISIKGRKNIKWLYNGYKFESDIGNKILTLDLLKKYLIVYPQYKNKYLSKLTVLYLNSNNYIKSYKLLIEYFKIRKNVKKKEKLFEKVIQKSILKKNHKFTFMLLEIYKKFFLKSIKVKSFILTCALQSGDPYFARDIALKILNS